MRYRVLEVSAVSRFVALDVAERRGDELGACIAVVICTWPAALVLRVQSREILLIYVNIKRREAFERVVENRISEVCVSGSRASLEEGVHACAVNPCLRLLFLTRVDILSRVTPQTYDSIPPSRPPSSCPPPPAKAASFWLLLFTSRTDSAAAKSSGNARANRRQSQTQIRPHCCCDLTWPHSGDVQ